MTERIVALFRAKHLNQKSAAQLLDLSGPKISKVISGEQTLSGEAFGILIREFNVHPNWLFGYIGTADEVIYMSNLVPESELAARDKQIQELKNELGEVYKQLAEERRNK
ncbi:helix-turn-helix domain-containing protein [Dyadobacter arcticus]|uniref:Transcriptional regulator with XRE-family HTH domain n=1 Tax=Dyadobacter arcticus TaxID=1078754 RepID=A0ABX0ULB3_9BACT|nr:helix-turn-helix transcriptional regulator [Dyadobacter arcticus]NIJ52859.1 transcriptional regulator with XRE-family HTH domain [Dyadobacter arcticus]